MKLKQQVFSAMAPLAPHYRWFFLLAVCQALLSVAALVLWPKMHAGYWLFSVMLFALWLCQYAILRLIHHRPETRRGFLGRIAEVWETFLFILWVLAIAGVFFLLIKVASLTWL